MPTSAATTLRAMHVPLKTQVTTIKDAAFGLGYHPRKTPAMAAAVVDLVASKPRHAGQQEPKSTQRTRMKRKQNLAPQ